MADNHIYLGNTLQHSEHSQVTGGYVKLEGETFYKISHYDKMAPFFMSVVSDCDHWMFISSLGGLTAGRKNADNALFPYGTDDKITDGSNFTGSTTLILANIQGRTQLWEPFSNRYQGIYQCQRNLYKNIYGDKLVFEEINLDLQLIFRYSWKTSDKFGFVKTSSLENIGTDTCTINLLDGLENILPYGVNKGLQQEYSCLVDAYKKNELEPNTGLGLYSMSSILVDRAEPSEALSATSVWSYGLNDSKKLLSSLQIDAFRQGCAIEQEIDIRGRRGAYFVNSKLELSANSRKKWYIVADINQGPAAVDNLQSYIANQKGITQAIEQDIALGSENLARIVGNSDGLQVSADTLSANHHFSNVLFNVMRGGLFDDNYTIDKNDLIDFVTTLNRHTANSCSNFFNELTQTFHYSELITRAEKTDNAHLVRACYEYLPLTFSRRHGDPSRPWNKFSIDLKNTKGEKRLNFEGNWRDIFQNWEALSLSIPNYIEGMISKFVNATTADGYNPYRITKQGIDWEELDPEDPWSNIGYWGDHQIIYLLKLLELSQAYHPGALQGLLSKDIFCYANVPYSIKPYEALLANPHDTINYDQQRQQLIDERITQVGADGKMLWQRDGTVYHVNLVEKILATSLAKLSNFIPEGGIWMNTQRPEWNDANNALVGFGVSMVTLYYLRRFQTFFAQLIANTPGGKYSVSSEIVALFTHINQALNDHNHLLTTNITDSDRKQLVDQLGQAGANYRAGIYQHEFSGERQLLSVQQLQQFCDLSLRFIDHTIAANQRQDGLYHAYNLMSSSKEGIHIEHLYEMLEGQVAVLSSGYLKPTQAITLFTALRRSRLYTERQHSYLLYPDRQLARFVDKNTLPKSLTETSQLLSALVAAGDTQLIESDNRGAIHFNGQFNNIHDVENTLQAMRQSEFKLLVDREAGLITEIFEDVFNHKAFTGRSGGMYAYEGLGSIYWHMVSKLLLAALENYHNAMTQDVDNNSLQQLADIYYDIRAGIGFNKTPDNYGAFPTDPYSHTPGFAGAKQPGMTGQVKEEIITRQGELGVTISQGKIQFKPVILRKSEFLQTSAELIYFDVSGTKQTIALTSGQLAFTLCQVPIIYTLSDQYHPEVSLTTHSGAVINMIDDKIDRTTAQSIFSKQGEITRIDVKLQPQR